MGGSYLQAGNTCTKFTQKIRKFIHRIEAGQKCKKVAVFATY